MPKSILLVEDDADDLVLFIDALNEINSDVGIDSLIKPKDKLPDLVVMDINMPGKNVWNAWKISVIIPG